MTEPTQEHVMPSAGALFLERHMKREQTAFVIFISVFMMLLVGIAVLFIYNGFVMQGRLSELRTESLRARFEAVGAIAQARADSQSARESQQGEFAALSHQMNAAREDLQERLRATRDSAASLVADADLIARAHVLGWPLNESSAQLVTAAREADALTQAQAAMLDYALADWRGDRGKAREALTILGRFPAYAGIARAGDAARLYAQASNPTGVDYAWLPGQPMGCHAVARAAREALDLLAADGAVPLGFENKGLTLNLHYFKGQCERKNGMADAGYHTFRQALDLIETADVTDDTPYKFQAYHGAGTTLMVTAGANAGDLPENPLDAAEELLWTAAALRRRWGATQVGETYSTENISFVYIREGGVSRWDKILRHTQDVDNVISLSWNLTARYIAAHEKARLLSPGDAEGCQAMRDIIFDTGAKLSRRPRNSFDPEELQKLVTEDYAPYVGRAVRWTDYADLAQLAGAAQFTSGSLDGVEQSSTAVRVNQMIEEALRTPCGDG